VRRRFLVLIFLASVLLALLFWRRSPPASPAPVPVAHEPARMAPMRAFDQRPAVTLLPQSGAGAKPMAAPSGAFEGRVVSALTGKGLPGAQLTFARAEETSSVIAGPDGSFRFDARVPGRWSLAAATAKGHEPFAPEWGQSPVQLTARAGETVRGILVTLLPIQEYEGHVVDAAKKPVADAEITVLGGGIGANTLTQLQTRYRSDAAGLFRFSAPEEAILEVRHAGFATARARMDISVRISRKLTIELKASSEPALSIEGVVEDANGPAENVAVSASPKNEIFESQAMARSDAQGRFKLTDLSSGTWTVVANRPGSAPATAEAEAGKSDLRLVLKDGGKLIGRVTGKHGGAPIGLFTLLIQSPGFQSISFVDPGGRYQVEGLRPGPAVVSCVAPGHAPSSGKRVTIPEPGAALAELDFELGEGGKLTGLVVERGTGQALPGAEVSVEGTGASQGVPIRNQTLTGPDGTFTLEALEETAQGITASAPGHHVHLLSVPPIKEGETGGPVRIELTPLKPGEDPQIELTGIGVALGKQGDALVIGTAAPGGGAAEVGLGPGDSIVAIEGAKVAPMTLGEAVQLLRGPEGTLVTLSVIKAGSAQPMTIAVPRRLIRV
jgi:hypothetical protein